MRSLAARMRVDVSTLLPDLTTPAPVSHARDDQMVDFTIGRELAVGIPDARLVTLDSDNHITLADEQAWPVFVEEVGAFLAADRVAGAVPDGDLRSLPTASSISAGEPVATMESSARGLHHVRTVATSTALRSRRLGPGRTHRRVHPCAPLTSLPPRARPPRPPGRSSTIGAARSHHVPSVGPPPTQPMSQSTARRSSASRPAWRIPRSHPGYLLTVGAPEAGRPTRSRPRRPCASRSRVQPRHRLRGPPLPVLFGATSRRGSVPGVPHLLQRQGPTTRRSQVREIGGSVVLWRWIGDGATTFSY